MDDKLNVNRVLSPLLTPTPSNFKYKIGDEKDDKTSFGDMFKGFLNDVNGLQNKSHKSIQKMIAGEIKDPHQVMLAVGEAKMALNLLIEVRNKSLDAYQEIINMRM